MPGAPGAAMEGRNTQTLREGPLWRLAPTAGKLDSFIESVKCAAWSLAWSLRGLCPPGDLLPNAEMDRRTDCGWDSLPKESLAVSFLGGRGTGRKRVGKLGGNLS